MARFWFFLFVLLHALTGFSQLTFSDYFYNKSMRLDYMHAGNCNESAFYFHALKEEPFWGGSQVNLIDTFRLGDYYIKLFDKQNGQLIYSRGYSSLFREWQRTQEAKSIHKSFPETVTFPYPKRKVWLELHERNDSGVFLPRYRQLIDPQAYTISKERPLAYDTLRVWGQGAPEKSLDIVIIPEGYTANELIKFKADANRFRGYFFAVEPFKSQQANINLWAVWAPSAQRGTDIPSQGHWVRTQTDSHFDTFGSARYLTTSNIHKLRDLASLVPYDQIYILVNTTHYGGGGIYNFYNLCVSDNPYAEQVFTHEFGHAFGALADEYAYSDDPAHLHFDMTREPWQPNISNLIDLRSKWGKQVAANTPIPTPDSLRQSIGAFEGAGNIKQKIYRPMYNCKMRANNVDYFCVVCKSHLAAMLQFYTQ